MLCKCLFKISSETVGSCRELTGWAEPQQDSDGPFHVGNGEGGSEKDQKSRQLQQLPGQASGHQQTIL